MELVKKAVGEKRKAYDLVNNRDLPPENWTIGWEVGLCCDGLYRREP